MQHSVILILALQTAMSNQQEETRCSSLSSTMKKWLNYLVKCCYKSEDDEIRILATGKWRDNETHIPFLESMINSKITILSQEDEGKYQAQCAHSLMCQQGLLPIQKNKGDDDLFLYVGSGRGSTQFTLLNLEGELVKAINIPTGYPKDGEPDIDILQAYSEQMVRDYGEKRVKFILAFGSIFHVLREKNSPVVPDNTDLPIAIATTTNDFSDLGYFTDLYIDTPMLVVRNFVMKDGTERKISFATGDKPMIDLGTGSANLVDPKTGRQIESVELPSDWMTNDKSLTEVGEGLQKLIETAKNKNPSL